MNPVCVRSEQLFLGIDPGKSGACALVDGNGRYRDAIRLSETPGEIVEFLRAYCDTGIDFCAIEKVHSRPGNSGRSMFTFGASFGFCLGMLVTLRIRYVLVTPSDWMGSMKCRTKGDKNVTKIKAEQLFAADLPPGKKIAHWNADALLLAEYARTCTYRQKLQMK